ncbi:small ribosomal subunit protein mS25-like [Physella acuta]|uniref:small ribosomal subunit protein mS25-like n=1 Tax=Physella acuta TaxID=109671 RepID=UPI0027DDF46A|nr:small ribosomal subunit protein mS25-like [Physella acuta]
MPFMKGAAPIRRTLKYLEKGSLVFKDNVKIVTFNFNRNQPSSEGTKQFVFWHFAQMQYKNPDVQMCVYNDLTPSPFFKIFFSGGSKLVLDIASQDKDEIFNQVKRIFCKNEETLPAEALAKEKKTNPANFGANCSNQCICEIPGQVPGPKYVPLPKEMRGKCKFQHKDVVDE